MENMGNTSHYDAVMSTEKQNEMQLLYFVEYMGLFSSRNMCGCRQKY